MNILPKISDKIKNCVTVNTLPGIESVKKNYSAKNCLLVNNNSLKYLSTKHIREVTPIYEIPKTNENHNANTNENKIEIIKVEDVKKNTKTINNTILKQDPICHTARKHKPGYDDKLLNIQNSKLVYVPIYQNTKHPSIKKWTSLTKTPLSIFKKYPNSNKALLTGKISNVTVLDVDNKKGGLEEWLEFVKEHPEINDMILVQVRTPSGGLHIYFKYTLLIATSIGLVGKNKDWDIRNDGACALIPDSIINDKPYTWIHNPKDTLIQDIPDCLLDYILTHTSPKEPTKLKKSEKEENIIKVQNIPTDDIYFIEDYELNNILKRLPEKYCNEVINWRLVTSALKNVDKYDIWNEWSKGSNKYDAVKNDAIWSNMNPIININYIINAVNINISKKNQIKYKIPTIKYNELDFDKVKCEIKTLKESDLDIRTRKHLRLEKYMKDHPKITTFIIKSGTGTGKTTTVAQTCNILQSENNDLQIISIVSRKSLVGQQIKTFKKNKDKSIELISYKDKSINPFTDNIVCQLDSISKHFDTDRDYSNCIIYIDEGDSLIKYMLSSSTLSKIRVNSYAILNKMIQTAKYVICTDADVSDVTMKYFEHFRDSNTSLLLINPIKNYKGLKAKRFCDQEGILNQMDENMKTNGNFFLAAFDQKGTLDNFWTTLWNKHPDKQHLMTKYTSTDGNEDDFANFTELNKGKYIFYSPKVIYGLDFVPDISTDVFVIGHGNTIDPKQMSQQATRCRDIKTLYYYMDIKSHEIKFKTAKECEEHIKENIQNYEAELKDLNILESSDPYCIKVTVKSNIFSELFYIMKYQSNILESNFIYHFNNILTEKGFELDVIGDTNKKIDFSDELKNQTIKEREQLIINVLNGSVENKQILERIDNTLEIVKLTKKSIYHNPTYWKIITDNKLFKSLMHFIKLVQDKDTSDQNLAKCTLHEFPENYIKSVESQIQFCHLIEDILKIRILEHDSDIIAKRQNEIIEHNGELLLKNYHVIFRDSERAKPLITFLDYYKVLIACYNHLIAYNFIKINTIKKQINNVRTYIFDNVAIKTDIIKPYLEIYGRMYPYYYNIHDDIVNTFKIGTLDIIKLDKLEKQIKYDPDNINEQDQEVNSSLFLPTIINTLPQKYENPTDDNEVLINHHIDEIYQSRSYTTQLDELVDRLSYEMNIKNNISCSYNGDSIKSFIDSHYEITSNEDDLIDKNIFTERYREFSKSSETFIKLLPHIKEMGIVYDRTKRYNKERGFIIGLKCKKVIDIVPKQSNKINNNIYMLGDDKPEKTKKITKQAILTPKEEMIKKTLITREQNLKDATIKEAKLNESKTKKFKKNKLENQPYKINKNELRKTNFINTIKNNELWKSKISDEEIMNAIEIIEIRERILGKQVTLKETNELLNELVNNRTKPKRHCMTSY